jgi:hypothetical protein
MKRRYLYSRGMNFSSRPDLGERWASRVVATAAAGARTVKAHQELSGVTFAGHQRPVTSWKNLSNKGFTLNRSSVPSIVFKTIA